MTKFEDQLYADLMRDHGPALAGTRLPAASRRHIASRRVLLATGAGGVAVAAAAGALAAGGGTPAYAVTANRDGTVTLAVYQASGIAQANAKLRQLGDNVVVVPVQPGCLSITSLPAPVVSPRGPVSVGGTGSADGSITVDAHGVPAGDIMVVGVETSGQGVGVAARLTSPPAPSCVSLPSPPPGNSGPGGVTSGGSGGGPGLNAAHGSGSGPAVSREG
jgi:hypothetical protein